MAKGTKSKRENSKARKKELLSRRTVTVFQHRDGFDSSSFCTSVYFDIDTQTGELTKTNVIDRDIFLRPGSQSLDKKPVTYEDFYRSLKNYHAENLNILMQLTRENYREWLDEYWEYCN